MKFLVQVNIINGKENLKPKDITINPRNICVLRSQKRYFTNNDTEREWA